MGKIQDLSGRKFCMLLVIERVENAKDGHARWLCKCDCGKTVAISSNVLKRGDAKSCGCAKGLFISKKATKHGQENTRLYRKYRSIINRCFNPNVKEYANYGGRGITICPEWLDRENGFINFYKWANLTGYEENLTIERIDVNGNYEPSNCRWATRKEQANNKRNNRKLSYNGKTKSLAQWEEETGISRFTLRQRLVRGWPVEIALTTPVIKKEETECII